MTVIGTSKGAELALLLPGFYRQVENVVAFTPADHVYQGLDFTRRTPASSWTRQGRDVGFVGFGRVPWPVMSPFVRDMVLGRPASLRPVYESAVATDPGADAARIDITRLRGQLLLFAGDADTLWPADTAVAALLEQRPDRSEGHVYPGAGHIFDLPGSRTGRFALGGSADANAAAAADSSRILAERLAAGTH